MHLILNTNFNNAFKITLFGMPGCAFFMCSLPLTLEPGYAAALTPVAPLPMYCVYNGGLGLDTYLCLLVILFVMFEFVLFEFVMFEFD